MGIKIKITKRNAGQVEIFISGRLDAATYAEADKALDTVLADSPDCLLLDMKELDYISSMGLRTIIKARKGVESKGGKVLLANLQPQIAKVFEIAAALPKENIFASVEEADAYFDLMQKKALED